MIKQIRQKFNEEKYRITRHCQRRCDSRGISLNEIKEVIAKGKLIETYPKDYPYPSYLFSAMFTIVSLFISFVLWENLFISLPSIGWTQPNG